MADAKTWAKRVAAWRASGQTATEFASRGGFQGRTLRWWAWRLRDRGSNFVRVVRALEPAARESAIELELGGVRVLVRAGFDRGALGEVLAIVRGSAPS